jgi:hypothetical protein
VVSNEYIDIFVNFTRQWVVVYWYRCLTIDLKFSGSIPYQNHVMRTCICFITFWNLLAKINLKSFYFIWFLEYCRTFHMIKWLTYLDVCIPGLDALICRLMNGLVSPSPCCLQHQWLFLEESTRIPTAFCRQGLQPIKVMKHILTYSTYLVPRSVSTTIPFKKWFFIHFFCYIIVN